MSACLVILCLNFDKLAGSWFLFSSLPQPGKPVSVGILNCTDWCPPPHAATKVAGTAFKMAWRSCNDNPIREGLGHDFGPAIDSGLVLYIGRPSYSIVGNHASEGGIKGPYCLNSFEQPLPGYGHYLLMVMVFSCLSYPCLLFVLWIEVHQTLVGAEKCQVL